MVKFYKSPEVPDQDKDDSGNILFSIQKAPTYKPLFGYINNTNNSAIVSSTAVKYTSKGVEISRTSLPIDQDSNLIIVDTVNNLYKIDLSFVYDSLLDECIYRFEVQNDSELYKSEYFLVQEESIFLTFDTNVITWDTNLVTWDQIKLII